MDYKAPKANVDKDLNYPLSAQLEKIEGSALVGVFVGNDGLPIEIKIVRSSKSALLDSAALEFSKSVTYTPATMRGKPVSSWTHLELRYKLQEVEFDHRVWLREVHGLKEKIAIEKDPYQRNIFLQRLYLKYLALAGWDNHSRRYDKKYIIRLAVDKESRKKWNDILSDFSAPFILFDEFLKNYPDCEFREKVVDTFATQMIETKCEIREKAQKSSRYEPKSLILLEMMDERLKELVKISEPPT